ncbi:dethiobiotin synthase [Phenylobacterium hankyongense]|uniref:ATP-dependent dethiobiotin synthetase BioD n=1 Tax=Phenylobacterium hankyongense TaxID=1813876 RepID=A0A328B2U8_9CAUL|nr:dethiobiotin synthase [Phenylobacterium hankyongense]RAK59338.1 dethiobiotin synthase [Phenylobacterium hankyongense]
MRPALFVAGAHTDIGKTHVAAALLRAARARGLTADALKPVVSGFDPDDWAPSDPGRLLEALGRPATPEALEAISPFRFAAPLAPPMAARLEGRRLELAPLTALCRAWLAAATAELRLVEGVGGLMSPIAEDATGLDLMAALQLPTVLVGGSYLGGISHTLTALEVLRSRGLAVAALVVSEDGSPDAPDFKETVQMVCRFAGATRVLGAGRDTQAGWPTALLEAVIAGAP